MAAIAAAGGGKFSLRVLGFNGFSVCGFRNEIPIHMLATAKEHCCGGSRAAIAAAGGGRHSLRV